MLAFTAGIWALAYRVVQEFHAQAFDFVAQTDLHLLLLAGFDEGARLAAEGALGLQQSMIRLESGIEGKNDVRLRGDVEIEITPLPVGKEALSEDVRYRVRCRARSLLTRRGMSGSFVLEVGPSGARHRAFAFAP